jgi:hypothetical protein
MKSESDAPPRAAAIDWLRDPFEKRIKSKISDDEWAIMRGALPPRPSFDPDDPADRDEWLDDAEPVWRRIVDERQRARQGGTVVRVDRVGRPEDPRYTGLAEILAFEAANDPQVVEWRKKYLPSGPVDPAALVETLAKLGLAGEFAAAARERDALWRLRNRARDPRLRLRMPLQELVQLADRLATGFNWLADDAIRFVLTSEPPTYYPLIRRLRITDRAATSRITLEIDPRLPQAEVAKRYAEVQRSPEMRHLLAGGSSRSIEARTSALAVFIARRFSYSWRDRQERWNAEHPDWAYRDIRAFRTDARRAWRRVVGSDLPSTEDQWLMDIRHAALTNLPPGSVLPPRIGLTRSRAHVETPFSSDREE